MIQFNILSGKKAGDVYVARRFPVRIGRSPAADLQLEEEGVWDQHLLLDFKPDEGFMLSVQLNALAVLNGQCVQQNRLHNGDVIQIGPLKLQFWLSDARQRGLHFRESLTWVGIAALSLGQIGLIYWLLP